MRAPTIIAVIACAAVFACDRAAPPTRPQPIPSAAASPQSSDAPTDWEPRFADFPLATLEPVWMREEYVPRLEYDPRLSSHTPDELRASLRAHHAQVESLIEVSRDLPGVIPPFAFGDPERTVSNDHLREPRGRVMNSLRVLRADAVRLHEDGDDAEGFRRLGAAARISLAFARQPDEYHQSMGLGSGATVLYESSAILRDGTRGSPAPDDVAAILSLAEHLEASVTIEAPKLHEAIGVIRDRLTIAPGPG